MIRNHLQLAALHRMVPERGRLLTLVRWKACKRSFQVQCQSQSSAPGNHFNLIKRGESWINNGKYDNSPAVSWGSRARTTVDESSFKSLESQLSNALLSSTVRARQHHEESTIRRKSIAHVLAVGFGEVPGCRSQQTRLRSKANACSFPLH
jgi:hypothetical protein